MDLFAHRLEVFPVGLAKVLWTEEVLEVSIPVLNERAILEPLVCRSGKFLQNRLNPGHDDYFREGKSTANEYDFAKGEQPKG